MTSDKKRHNSAYIVVLSVVLLCLAVSVYILFGSQTEYIPVSLKITSGNITEEIKPWYNDDGKWYFFVPSYANGENTVLNPQKRGCYLQNSLLTGEESLDAVEIGVEYRFEQHGLLTYFDTTVVFMKSANVPTMYIKTISGELDNVHSDKENKEQINISLYGDDGEPLYIGNEYADEIRGHGNSTWYREKKPYNLYFSIPQSFFGSQLGTNWVLLANDLDQSKVRNYLFFSIAENTSEKWSPIGDYVDLFLNNEYVGQYFLVEKVEAAENKICLKNGEILLNFEASERAKKYSIDGIFQGMSAEICSPKNLTQESIEKNGRAIKKIAETVKSGRTTDEYLKAHVDLESWAWKYILEELSYNYDAGSWSQYFSFDGTMIRSQAAWDYDNTLGLEVHNSPTSFLANREWKKDGRETAWFSSLLKYNIFSSLVKQRFSEVFYPILKEYIDVEIPKICKRINQSALMDEVRWPGSYQKIQWEEAITQVQSFFEKRVDFLTSAWIDNVEYHTICLKGADQYLYYSVEDGTVFDEIPNGEDVGINNFLMWIDEQTEQEFDSNQIITENKTLYALCDEENTDSNNTNNIMTWIIVHKSLVLLAVLCISIAFMGMILVCFDAKHSCKRRSR